MLGALSSVLTYVRSLQIEAQISVGRIVISVMERGASGSLVE